MANPKILVVITARGGSKGVPRKNVRDLAGKPLLAHTIEVVQKSRHPFHDAVLSTDDPEIAACGREYGISVPFMRPEELARDGTPSLPVLQHAAEFIEQRDNVRLDWIVTLQPTSPLRRVEDLDALVEAGISDPKATSSVNAIEVIDGHPLKLKRIVDGYFESFVPGAPSSIRRQDLQPPIFRTNGAGYMTRRDIMFEQNDLFGAHCVPVMMPPEYSIDINTEFDLRLAEFLKRNLDVD